MPLRAKAAPDERIDGETIYQDRFREYYLQLSIDHLELQEGKQLPAWFYDDYSAALEAAGHLEAYRKTILSDEQVYTFPIPEEWHPDAWVGRKAVEYIEAYDGSKPLFVWVSFSGPHYPFDPPEEYLSRVNVDAMAPRKTRSDEFDDPTKIHAPSHRGADGLRRVDANKSVPATQQFSQEYWTTLREHYYANVALIDEWGRDRVYAEGGGFCAITDGDWKYIRLEGTGEIYDELYDLEADPGEYNDLSDDSDRSGELATLREDLLFQYLDAALPFHERFDSTE